MMILMVERIIMMVMMTILKLMILMTKMTKTQADTMIFTKKNYKFKGLFSGCLPLGKSIKVIKVHWQ